jgi:plastocyanin
MRRREKVKDAIHVAESRLALGARASHWVYAIVLTLAFAAFASCGYDDNGYSSTPPTTTGELNSGNIAPSATFQHRFMTAGTFPYHCIYHSPMTGSVSVDAGAPDTLVNVSIASSSAPFPAASVKPGGRVVWTNNTTMIHTVTSN